MGYAMAYSTVILNAYTANERKRKKNDGKTTQTATTNHIKIDTNNDDSSPAACVCYGHRKSDVRTRLRDTSTKLKGKKKKKNSFFLFFSYVIYACVYFSCPKVHYWCVAKATFIRFNGVHKNLIKLELDERVRIRFTWVVVVVEFLFRRCSQRSLLCAVCIPFSYVHSFLTIYHTQIINRQTWCTFAQQQQTKIEELKKKQQCDWNKTRWQSICIELIFVCATHSQLCLR